MEPAPQSSPAAAPPHPVLNAMVVCDSAMQDEATGKTTLVGLFENISATQFPTLHGLLCVYAKLTDAQGEYRIRLELVRLEDLAVVGQGRLGVTFADRMTPAELVFQIAGLRFERPGRYEFRLYANDHWVGSKSLSLVQAPESQALPEQVHVFGSRVTVRWLQFMLPGLRPPAGAA